MHGEEQVPLFIHRSKEGFCSGLLNCDPRISSTAFVRNPSPVSWNTLMTKDDHQWIKHALHLEYSVCESFGLWNETLGGGGVTHSFEWGILECLCLCTLRFLHWGCVELE